MRISRQGYLVIYDIGLRLVVQLQPRDRSILLCALQLQVLRIEQSDFMTRLVVFPVRNLIAVVNGDNDLIGMLGFWANASRLKSAGTVAGGRKIASVEPCR